mgnify:CR=1 FL=1|jgi:hypothetical protein
MACAIYLFIFLLLKSSLAGSSFLPVVHFSGSPRVARWFPNPHQLLVGYALYVGEKGVG